jgi:hypothetical protein
MNQNSRKTSSQRSELAPCAYNNIKTSPLAPQTTLNRTTKMPDSSCQNQLTARESSHTAAPHYCQPAFKTAAILPTGKNCSPKKPPQ